MGSVASVRFCGVLLLGAILTLPACGSPSDEEAARDVIEAFYSAFSEGDGETACALLTGPAIRELLEDASPSRNCQEAISFFAGMMGEEEKRAFREVKLLRVDVSGGRARVEDRDVQVEIEGFSDSDPRPLELQKLSGEWKIASLG